MRRYLNADEVTAINAYVIRRFGGRHAIRDHGALKSAVGRPESGYYADAIEEAEALFESLSQNHPFVDGNKRTAVTSTGVFLLLNGFHLQFTDSVAYAWLIGLYESAQLNKANVEA